MLPIIISTLDNDLDRDFMTWLYEEYEPLLFKVAQRFALTHHDVEEIVQDSLERLIKKISTIRHMERCILSAYIVSTVRNTSIEFLRKEKRRQARQRNYDDTSWTMEMQPQLSLEEHCDFLGHGIAGFINIFSPQKIVIGGGLSEAGDFYIQKVSEKARSYAIPDCAVNTQIIAAALGNKAGSIGAASLFFK